MGGGCEPMEMGPGRRKNQSITVQLDTGRFEYNVQTLYLAATRAHLSLKYAIRWPWQSASQRGSSDGRQPMMS